MSKYTDEFKLEVMRFYLSSGFGYVFTHISFFPKLSLPFAAGLFYLLQEVEAGFYASDHFKIQVSFVQIHFKQFVRLVVGQYFQTVVRQNLRTLNLRLTSRPLPIQITYTLSAGLRWVWLIKMVSRSFNTPSMLSPLTEMTESWSSSTRTLRLSHARRKTTEYLVSSSGLASAGLLFCVLAVMACHHLKNSL